MQLIQTGAEHCFSELKFQICNNHCVVEGLARICKSLKTLECHTGSSNLSGLIEAQKI